MNSHPRAGPTRVPRRLIAGGAIAIALSASWALWPVQVPNVPDPMLDSSTDKPRSAMTLTALNLDAFRTPIWVSPPPPPEPEKPAAPPPPLKLQLLAILSENGVYKAALYDPDTDTVLVVAAGETLGSARTVESVLADRVAVRDARGLRTLALREEQRP
jgi:hypothetical protein